jgi:predicted branched-subunit amino acid permease
MHKKYLVKSFTTFYSYHPMAMICGWLGQDEALAKLAPSLLSIICTQAYAAIEDLQ